MTYRHLLILSITLLLLTSCGKEKVCGVPIGDATCQIDPDSPLYPGLNNIGGYVYLTGGYSGLIAIKTFVDQYVVFERTCPYDTSRLEILIDTLWNADHTYYRLAPNSSLITCPQCHSLYNAIDGIPIAGSKTRCPLYQYNAHYDGNILYINNY